MATWPTAETFTPTAIAPLKLARPCPGHRPDSETTLTIRGPAFWPPGRVHPPCAALADDAETRRGRAVAVSTKTYCPTALLPYCPTALLPYCPTALLPYCPLSFDLTLQAVSGLTSAVSCF